MVIKLVHCANIDPVGETDVYEKFVFFMPMGIFSLGSVLHKNNFDVQLVHLDLESRRSLRETLELEKADIVAFDLFWANQSIHVMNCANYIKNNYPDIFILLGGYTASYYATEILETYQCIDAIIQGDAEVPILKLVNNIDKNCQEFENVPNLVYRKDNKVVRNKISYVASRKEIDEFDFDCVHLLNNWEVYRSLSTYWTKFDVLRNLPVFFIEVGRGCCYNCSICGGSSQVQKKINGRQKQITRSCNSVVNSIKKLSHLGYNTFFTCFDFPGHTKWYLQLLDNIKENGLRINFINESWSLPSKEIIDKFSETFEYSLFTISPDSAIENNRSKSKDSRLFYSNTELEECLDYIGKKQNVFVQLYFGYFLPDDTIDTILETLKYIADLTIKYGDYVEISYMNLNTDPGSLLFENPSKYKMDKEVNHFKDYIEYQEAINENGGNPTKLLSFPAHMNEIEIKGISNIITIFSSVLHFKRSVKLLFDNKSIIEKFIKYIHGNVNLLSKQKYFSYRDVNLLILNFLKSVDLKRDGLRDELLREEKQLKGSYPLKSYQHYLFNIDRNRQQKSPVSDHSFSNNFKF